MGHYDPQGLVDAVPGLSRADADAILGLNAAALLGMPGAAAPLTVS